MNYRLLILFSTCLLTACSDESGSRAIGTLERDRITLTAPASETLIESQVQEGQKVKAGDLLLQLDPTRAQARLSAQQAMLRQASAHLQELENGARPEERAAAQARVEGAQAALTEAEQQLQRSRTLLKRNLTGQADVDSATARRDSAAAALQQAQEQFAQLQNGTRSEQLVQASAAVASARAQADIAAKELQDLSIVAPLDGRIDALPWHTGDRLSQGTIAATLLSDATPYARIYLPANALPGLSIGSQVTVQIDGMAAPVTGKLTNIRSQPAFTPYFALNERDRAALMYLSEVRFASEQAQLLENIPSGRTLEVVLP